MTTGEAIIVAKTRSRYGGKCQCPQHEGPNIERNDWIYKVTAEGRTTQHGQGPGFWVCVECRQYYSNPQGLS